MVISVIDIRIKSVLLFYAVIYYWCQLFCGDDPRVGDSSDGSWITCLREVSWSWHEVRWLAYKSLRSSHPRKSLIYLIYTLYIYLCLSALGCSSQYSLVLFLSEHFNHYVWSKKFPTHTLVMLGWMMFGPIIRIIEFSRAPVNAKLFLAFSVPEPMESHVHGLCSFWLYFAVDDSIGHWIVRL